MTVHLRRTGAVLLWSVVAGACVDWESARDVSKSTSADNGALGVTCSASGDCGSGFCVDGVCCDGACEGQCEACNGAETKGQCLAVKGAPVGPRAACTGVGTVCGGSCDGTQRASCVYPTSACRSESCAGGQQAEAAVCDHGLCPAEVKHACGLGECQDETACLTIVSFDVGNVHSCAALSNGTVRCWGDGSFSQLGLGTDKTFRNVPTPVPNVSNVVEVAVGGNHACVRHSDKTVSCWGYNNAGQSTGNDGENGVPLSVPGLTNVRSLGLGQSHSCAVTEDDRAFCWGLNAESELGTGATDPILSRTPLAVCAMGTTGACGSNVATNVDRIRGGSYHTCMLTKDGAVACWGLNGQGEAGQMGNAGNVLNPSQVHLSGRTPVALDLSGRSSCLATSSGEALCWGSNGYDALGIPTIASSTYIPQSVCTKADCTTRIVGATAVAHGGQSGCAIRLGGAVSCWGANGNGELGDGTTTTPRPFAVAGPFSSGVLELKAGGAHKCALLGPEDLRCWGLNSTGQLGNGDPDLANQSTAVPVKWK